MTTTHDFAESLRYSHEVSAQPWVEQGIRALMPGAVHVQRLPHDAAHQRLGRDWSVMMSTGGTIYLDDKLRTEDWPDVALERWSVYPVAGQRPYPPVKGTVNGWAVEPTDADFILYGWVPARRLMLLPVPAMRTAFMRHGLQWRDAAMAEVDGFRFAEARTRRNGGAPYLSVSIVVPIPVLEAAMTSAQTWTADQ